MNQTGQIIHFSLGPFPPPNGGFNSGQTCRGRSCFSYPVKSSCVNYTWGTRKWDSRRQLVSAMSLVFSRIPSGTEPVGDHLSHINWGEKTPPLLAVLFPRRDPERVPWEREPSRMRSSLSMQPESGATWAALTSPPWCTVALNRDPRWTFYPWNRFCQNILTQQQEKKLRHVL